MNKIYLLVLCLFVLDFYCPDNDMMLIGDYRPISGLSTQKNSNLIISKEGDFKKSDVGKTIIVYGAGVGSDGGLGDELVAIIESYLSPNEVQIDRKSALMVAYADGGLGTDNSSLFTNFFRKATQRIEEFEFPRKGNFLFIHPIRLERYSGLKIKGNGVSLFFISANPNSYIGGNEPKRNLIELVQCNNIEIEDFKVYNAGQKHARNNIKEEAGFWKVLNGKETNYNRHYNKQANTGAFVQVKECQNIEISRIRSFNTGCLFSTFPGEKFNENSGGAIRNCIVTGWGFSAVYPGHNMLIEDNIFNNEPAPVLSSEDINKKLGSSHAIYSTSGYSAITIRNNKIAHCRGTAIQFNTKDKDECIGNVIEKNRFEECSRNGSFYGSSNPLEVSIRDNTYVNCGRWEIDQPNALITFDNETVKGQPSGNDDFRGFLSFSRVATLLIKNSDFIGVVKKGNVGVIQMSSHSGINRGVINIQGNYFDSTNNRAFLHLLDHNDFTGKFYLKNNTIDSEVRFLGLHGVPSQVSGNGKNKFFVENNTFGANSSCQVVARFGVTLKGNKHFLKNSRTYGIKMDLIDGAGESKIISCEFINSGGENPILLTKAKANNNSVLLENCTFKETNPVEKNGNNIKMY